MVQQQRNKRGSVVVFAKRDSRLTLRFRVHKKQYELSLFLDNNAAGRKLAALRAHQVKADIVNGEFDPSLEKYRRRWRDEIPRLPAITAIDIFTAFIEWKRKEVFSRTLEKYICVLDYLTFSSIGDKAITAITEADAQEFCDRLKQKLSPRTLKGHISLLCACWEWARDHDDNSIVVPPKNPWKPVLRRIKVPPKQPPKPFSVVEVKAILDIFQQQFPSYYPFVLFMASTGLRTGEIRGLLWRHIADDFSSCWIGEALSKNIRKPTKTNTARIIPLSPRLQLVLSELKTTSAKPDNPVFTSVNGGVIDVDNFTKRYWVKALEMAGIPYRQPYFLRHSFVTNSLRVGMKPIEVASITGHSVETLYEHYVGALDVQLPDLY
jgi:integrase